MNKRVTDACVRLISVGAEVGTLNVGEALRQR